MKVSVRVADEQQFRNAMAMYYLIYKILDEKRSCAFCLCRSDSRRVRTTNRFGVIRAVDEESFLMFKNPTVSFHRNSSLHNPGFPGYLDVRTRK